MHPFSRRYARLVYASLLRSHFGHAWLGGEGGTITTAQHYRFVARDVCVGPLYSVLPLLRSFFLMNGFLDWNHERSRRLANVLELARQTLGFQIEIVITAKGIGAVLIYVLGCLDCDVVLHG